MTAKIILETERLKLFSLDAGDTEMFFDFLNRNAEFFSKWSPVYEKDYFTLWYHKAWLEGLERELKEGRQIKFGVRDKNNPNRIIGTVSFSNIIRGPFQSCFLGYRVDEHENKKGIATEAIRRGTEYIFDELKLHRIEANIMPVNAGSTRVVEKLGFQNEGLAKNYLKINGKWEDHFHWVLLNPNV